MALSVQAARRKEYPEMGEDVRMVSEPDPVTGKNKSKQARVPVKLTNTFWFTYRNPNTGKYERQALTYGLNKTRLLATDIRNWESEIGVMPSLVQRELNYTWDEKKKMWVEIMGSKNAPECYDDCTDDYFDHWRPDAMLNQEDPFKGMRRPKEINVMEFRLHLMERKMGLMEAKERNLVVPIYAHNTQTGEQAGMTKGQFEAPLSGEIVENAPQFIAEH
jgi:hypothetical protein